ncbi:unnamed protein product [Camellia sinensis]
MVRVRFRESSSSKMEASGGNSDAYRGSLVISSSNLRRNGMRSNYLESENSINSNGVSVGYQDHIQNDSSLVANNGGEVSIRIIGVGEQEHDRLLPPSMNAQNEAYGDSKSDRGVGESGSQSLNGDGEAVDGAGSNSRDSSYQRYDISQATRWIEQVLPFSLLLLVVFIRQHLQG